MTNNKVKKVIEFIPIQILKLLTLIVRGMYESYMAFRNFVTSKYKGIWILLLILIIIIVTSLLVVKQFRVFELEGTQMRIMNEAKHEVEIKEKRIEELEKEIKEKDEKIEEISYIQSRRTVQSVSSMSVEGVSVSNDSRLEGRVSHYSREGCLGCDPDRIMANGEPLDDSRLTIAVPPRTIPMNTKVKVTNLDNGKSIIAIVTDTGGFAKLNRIADLTPAVAIALETKTDISRVAVEVME